MRYEKLETVDELADRLRVPKSWIYGQTRIKGENAIPHIKVGKYCRFIPAEVDSWLEKQNSDIE